MKYVCPVENCVGCRACSSVCPTDAISIDECLITTKAYIDETRCINCNSCYSVCQQSEYYPSLTYPTIWLQGWSEDATVRNRSSSGGLAYSLSKWFINNGGYVCSCCFEDGVFHYKITNSLSDLELFSGSKYVKSNPSNCYNNAIHLLKEGHQLLFIGLPCHVAAMNALSDYYSVQHGLVSVDLICHGTPSQSVLDLFLKQYNLGLSELSSVSFRQNNRRQEIAFGPANVKDDYMSAFLNAYAYTSSCYKCNYAQINRCSDITIGDSWGTQFSDEELKKGISIVLCQTEKGKQLIESVDFSFYPVDIKQAIESNHQLSHPSVEPNNNKRFIERLERGIPFNKAFFYAMPKYAFKIKIKSLLIEMKLIRRLPEQFHLSASIK